MDISILGYKLNVEVLILIGVVYLILVSHMFCGCCNFGAIESFVSNVANVANDIKKEQDKKTNLPTQSVSGPKDKDVEPVPHTVSTTTSKEGFTGAQYNWLGMRGGNNVPYSQY